LVPDSKDPLLEALSVKIVHDDNPVRFLNLAEPLFEKEEAQYNLIWSIASSLAEGRRLDPKPPVFIRIEHDRKTIACALQASPHGLLLTTATQSEVNLMVTSLRERKIDVISAIGPALTVQHFADSWVTLTGKKARILMKQRMYQLTKVTFPQSPGGQMVQAESVHIPQVEEWMEAFAREAVPNDPDSFLRFRQAAGSRILSGDFFLWDTGKDFVSAACLSGATKRGVRISMVFTPPSCRNKGYASALVAHLAHYILQSGKDFCVLYTDELNPTSNGIYQKIGFKPIGDSIYYRFDG